MGAGSSAKIAPNRDWKQLQSSYPQVTTFKSFEGNVLKLT